MLSSLDGDAFSLLSCVVEKCVWLNECDFINRIDLNPRRIKGTVSGQPVRKPGSQHTYTRAKPLDALALYKL